jgi:hypothetical protein
MGRGLNLMKMNPPPFLILIPETGPLNETGYTQQMFIDEGPVVHVIEGRMVSTIPIGRIGGIGRVDKEDDESDVSSDDDTKTFLVAAGPSIKAIRTSPDGRYTALQRSRLHVEFIDHADIRQNTFIEAPLQTKDLHATLHGFFWTSTPRAEFVMVTSAGLEFRSFSPSPSSQGLISTGFQRLSNVCWFQWSQPTGILVLGCGSSGSRLQPFQFLPEKSFSSSEEDQKHIKRLPLLDLSPPWGVSPLTPISPSQVWILQLYGRIIIAYHETATSTLHLYIIRGWDSIIPLMEKVLHNGGPIELSVVDDVLVIHFMNENMESAFSIDFIDVQLAIKHGNIFRPRIFLETRADDRKDGMNMKLQLYHPDLAVNTDLGIFYRLKLDLNAIASACDDTELLIRFLASRKPRKNVTMDTESSDGSFYEQDPKHVLINVFRPLVARREMPSTLRRAFEALISSSCRKNGRGNEDVGIVEIVLTILQPLLLQRDDTLIESAYYVQAIIAQFIAASINTPNLRQNYATIHPSIVDLYIKAFVLAGQSWLLDAVFVRYAPLLDSRELADRLISHSPPVDDPTGFDCLEKLGVRMKARLNAM